VAALIISVRPELPGSLVRRNKRYFLTIQEGLATGYNGCRFCLQQHDTG
jgi:hypothetical protein